MTGNTCTCRLSFWQKLDSTPQLLDVINMSLLLVISTHYPVNKSWEYSNLISTIRSWELKGYMNKGDAHCDITSFWQACGLPSLLASPTSYHAAVNNGGKIPFSQSRVGRHFWVSQKFGEFQFTRENII